MNTTTQLYWPQHKLFFIATLALFPEKLKGHEVNQIFYRPYFAGETEEFIEIELADYKRAGYLEFDKSHALFRITEVHSKKAKADLIKYLKLWRQNRLHSLALSKPPDADFQLELLSEAFDKASKNNQSQPRISRQLIYGTEKELSYRPPFWELTLSLHFTEKKAKIKAIGYDQHENGFYDEDPQPFIEYKLDDAYSSELIKNRTEIHKDSQTNNLDLPAWLDMPAKHVILKIADGRQFLISSKQLNGLRTDLAPYSLLKFIRNNPNKTILLEFARSNIDGCDNVRDLGEVIRQAGFDEKTKNMVFEKTSAKKVRLRQSITLTMDDVAYLMEKYRSSPERTEARSS